MKMKFNFFLYLIAGFLFFLFWMVVVFPYDALESRVITEIENQTGGKYKLEMKDMDISLLFGSVTFEKLKILEPIGNKGKLLLETPKLKIGFSPLGLIAQKRDFSFYLKGTKKGDIEGKFKQEGAETELKVDFDDYPLSEMKFLSSKINTGFHGFLNGEIDLRLNQTDLTQNKGKIDINLENLRLDPFKIRLDKNDPNSEMQIPKIKISLGEGSHIKAKVIRDKLDVESIKLTGGDIDLDLQGKISLRGRSPQDFRLALQGAFKTSDVLAKSLFFLAFFEGEKNEQGYYPLTITGRIGKPGIRIGRHRVPLGGFSGMNAGGR